MEQDPVEGHGSHPLRDAVQVMSWMVLPLFVLILRFCLHWFLVGLVFV